MKAKLKRLLTRFFVCGVATCSAPLGLSQETLSESSQESGVVVEANPVVNENQFAASSESMTLAPMMLGTLPPMQFTTARLAETDGLSPGLDFNEFPQKYLQGLTLHHDRWAVKFGGYLKADLIHDFRAIESTDYFDPTTIPIGAPQYTNTRFHARQTRLNMDVRWIDDQGETLRFLVEGDFYGDNNTFRLRHAYGEKGNWLVGQTWTTFTHRAALPNTLDVLRNIVSVGQRQAQLRWSTDMFDDSWSFATSIENPQVTLDENLVPLGDARTPLPDFITRIRYNGEYSQFQLASLVRRIGFQPTGLDTITRTGAGLNATGYVDVTAMTRTYGGLLWGDGIGTYRELPDIALTSPTTGDTLPTHAYYLGLRHHWSKRAQTNVTYSKGKIQNTPAQAPDAIRQLHYLAVNYIYQPTKQSFVGIEGLWGDLTNHNLDKQDASRVMMSFGFLLP